MLKLPLLLLCVSPLSAQYRINAGGSAYTDPSGLEWAADKYFTGGFTTSATAPAEASQLYSTKRYGDFTYRLPVIDGAYNVTLYLLENSVTGPGQRSFSVTINGTPALAAWDEVAEIGFGIPAKRIFPALASNGTGIRIQFTTLLRSAFVNAIEITPANSYLQTDAYKVVCPDPTLSCGGGGTFALTRTNYGPPLVFLNGRLISDYETVDNGAPNNLSIIFKSPTAADGDQILIVYAIR